MIKDVKSVQNKSLKGIKISGNGVRYSIILVKNRDEIKQAIMDKVVEVMKGMQFNVIAMPEFSFDSSSIYNQVARFRRLIASGETL